MPMIVWMGAAALASSLPVAWWAVAADRSLNRRVSQNLAGYQPTMREAVLDHRAGQRFAGPVAKRVGSRLMRYTPAGWMQSKNTAIAKAGWTGRISAEQVLGAKILLPLLCAGYAALRALGGEGASTRGVLMTLGVVGLSFLIPDLLLSAKADRRADEITILLPDVLDQLTISVEAGLGFEAALSRITETETHPLAEEFGRMLQDVRLGTSRRDALEAMAKRSQVDDLKSVVLTLRQAEALGVPLAKSLRDVASEMREKRRFRAEERANKLPIKMIFPLGLCILPALFIVILGPAVIQFVELF